MLENPNLINCKKNEKKTGFLAKVFLEGSMTFQSQNQRIHLSISLSLSESRVNITLPNTDGQKMALANRTNKEETVHCQRSVSRNIQIHYS